MSFISKNWKGILVCLAIAIPSWIIGRMFPVVGGPIIAIILGMIITLLWTDKGGAADGIKFTSKVILQTAVVLLGFGLNLGVIAQTGKQSLPIIISTISIALIVAAVLHKAMKIPGKTSTLIGVGSSICGGSAIAAAAPVIGADDTEVAQSISVIFFFNVMAAIIFPAFGSMIGFDTLSGDAFGVFAGTAVNDTSSVTAAAATWDSMWGLGHSTLDTAVTVKLTRTLAIIPITLVLALIQARKPASSADSATTDPASTDPASTSAESGATKTEGFSLKRAFPMFILYFILASVLTTILSAAGISPEVFVPLKELSKFFIVMAMAAIGLNCNVIKLVKSGGKPILLGACCWVAITTVSLLMQHVMGIW